jgi:serine/threonine protein kinase
MDCLFKQLLLGIAHIHASGVAHRDVKPENLVMTEKGVLKIADFGVADVVQSCFETEPNLCKGQCGSEPYWPPELFKIERHGNDDREGYDGRAVDIWGAAVTWHCVLYKTIPFFKASHEDPNWSEYLKVRRNRDWLPLSKCTKDEKDCLYGMFDPNPKTRWTAEQCLNSEWIKNVPVCYESNEKHAHHILSA